MTHAQVTAFGLFAVSAMLVCYSLEHRNPWFRLGFAISCWLGSAYGFLQGAWPFGIVELVWGAVALQKWRRVHTYLKRHAGDHQPSEGH